MRVKKKKIKTTSYTNNLDYLKEEKNVGTMVLSITFQIIITVNNPRITLHLSKILLLAVKFGEHVQSVCCSCNLYYVDIYIILYMMSVNFLKITVKKGRNNPS